MRKKNNLKYFFVSGIIVIVLLMLITFEDEVESVKIAQTTVLNPDVENALAQLDIKASNTDVQQALLKLRQQSIIDTRVVFVESNQNEFEKFLDEEEPLGQTATPKFTLETAATLIDQNGNEVAKSSFLDIPLQSLTDQQGNILIGSAQVGFFAKTTESVELDAKGTVEFWLDDKKIATKKVFFTPDGKQKNTHQMFLDDTIKSTIINQVPRAFTYKFTDEPFDDLTTHTFRVIVKDFEAETIALDQRKKYSWSGEFLAYQLQMTVDKSKISIVNEDGDAISVFKDDNKLIVCDVPYTQPLSDFIAKTNIQTSNKVPPITVIRKSDNQQITTVDVTKTDINGIDYENGCAIFSGLQRSTDYLFHMAGNVYEIKTPRIQQNYYASCSVLAEITPSNNSQKSFHHVGDKCVSTFAKDWEFVYSARSGQKIKINSSKVIVCGTDDRIIGTAASKFSSNSPLFKSPEVEVFDGKISLGRIGGKTYCMAIDNLPKGKTLIIKISELKETGNSLESYGCSGGNTCTRTITNPPFPLSAVTIDVPTDISKEYTLECTPKWNGVFEIPVTVINWNIANGFSDGGWRLKCSGFDGQYNNG